MMRVVNAPRRVGSLLEPGSAGLGNTPRLLYGCRQTDCIGPHRRMNYEAALVSVPQSFSGICAPAPRGGGKLCRKQRAEVRVSPDGDPPWSWTPHPRDSCRDSLGVQARAAQRGCHGAHRTERGCPNTQPRSLLMERGPVPGRQAKTEKQFWCGGRVGALCGHVPSLRSTRICEGLTVSPSSVLSQ